VASTDHVYVASLTLNAAQVRRARRANSNAVTLKLMSRPPARRRACRVQVQRANLPDRQLGGACADWLHVNTPIYLHCIQRRSQSQLRFCRCVCANALKDTVVYSLLVASSQHFTGIYISSAFFSPKKVFRGLSV
jgi:hypothetical protein